MKPQILNITHNNKAGIFISMEDWQLIKESYPDLENGGYDIPQWEKDLINSRLEYIANNPNCFISKEEFFKELEREI